MTVRVEWEQAPEYTPAFHLEAALLMTRPGQWARVYHPDKEWADLRSVYNMAGKIRNGQYAAFRPEGSWEAQGLARETDGQPILLVRYVGKTSKKKA